MMQYYRFVLVTLIFLVSFLIWESWQKDYGGKKLPTTAEAQKDIPVAETAQDLPKAEPVESPDGSPAATEAEATPAASGPVVRVRTDVFDIEINPVGGDIMGARLLKYPVSPKTPEQPFVLMDHTPELWYVIQGGWLSGQQAPTHHTEYQPQETTYELKEGEDTLEARLTWTSESGLSITKVYTFERGSYLIDLHYEIKNTGSEAWSGRLYGQLQRGPIHRKSGFTEPYTFTGAVISSPEERYEKLDFEDMSEQPLDRSIKGGWAAMIQHYFISALIPDSGAEYRYYSKALNTPERYMIGLYGPELQVPPGGEARDGFKFYVGPKVQKVIEKIAPGLELTTDYGIFWFVAKPLFKLIEWLKQLTGNWGWAIILVTILVKAAFYRLSAASYKTSAKLKVLKPRMDALKEMYGDDKARMQQAIMDLYKREKVNPMGGCLPVLIQIPVFVALYWVLVESVEMRQAHFIWWLKDLSAPDPYFVLPFLNGVIMFLQQKMSPTGLDPVQEKVMQIMPIMFGVLFAFFASGLVLYWLVNNLLSIAQQWMITRQYGHLAQPAKVVEKA